MNHLLMTLMMVDVGMLSWRYAAAAGGGTGGDVGVISVASLRLKGTLTTNISVAIMIELLLKSFLVYHSPMFEAWKVPGRPAEVSCDVMQHLVANRTAVETRTKSSGMRTHTGQHSRLPCMHTLIMLD